MTTDPIATGSHVETKETPCVLHLVGGTTITVDEIDGWAYTPEGIFASGRINDGTKVEHTFVPNGRVEYMTFDFDALERANAAAQD